MTISIFHYCDSNEVSTLSHSILSELERTDWSSDQILSFIVNDLKSKSQALDDSIEYTRGNILRENVRAENEMADKDFIAFKSFVKANISLPIADKAQDARDIWEMTKSHNIDLHKLSYERQLALSKSLLANLDSIDFKAKVANLVGVAERIEAFRTSTNGLETAYNKLMEANANEVDVIAPSTLKNDVRKIINNNLIPYIENAAVVMPEMYLESFKIICEVIDKINTKAHARKVIGSKTPTEENSVG